MISEFRNYTGNVKNPLAIKELIISLKQLDISGTLYLGYPIIASVDDSIVIDALLVSEDIGLIVFSILEETIKSSIKSSNEDKLNDIDGKLYYAVKANLERHESLRKGRNIAVKINIVLYSTNLLTKIGDIKIATSSTIAEVLKGCEKTDSLYFKALNAAIQRVTTLKPKKKRDNVTKNNSKGWKLKEIERKIANLDRWQKQSAIETPEGPQRIRGLAGSGKTIVLALKAASLHFQKPNWNIAVVFQTRSLYQQFKDLIRRFSFDHYSDEPDWGKLKILHAWGSNSQPGLYLEIADKLDFPVRDFKFGMTMYGRENAFEGVCNEILDVIENKKIEPFYDAILIDEAQDLPIPFFKIIYKILSHPKRVIWAYDELQNLTNYSLPSLTDLFGTNDLGNPNVILENPDDGPRQDIILPICYRNTSWALTLAHALGFGINRAEGLVQICDDELWNEIGYNLIEGEFVADKKVSLQRKSNSSPEYFSELLSSKESVTCYCFNNFNEEVNWIADQIYINIKEDELDYDDILIILPDALTAKKKAYDVIQALRARKIPSHLAGVTSSVDEIFLPDSVAIANIYRAKGNEAPMVYIANSDYCNSGRELIKLRNSIFTAITRSRAWVRIVGSGTEMKNLEKEFNKLVKDEFVIKFTVPDESMRESLRTIHRELTAGEKANIKKAEEGFEKFLELVDKGDYDVNTLPIDTKNKLERILRG